jgi:hypothetical protein
MNNPLKEWLKNNEEIKTLVLQIEETTTLLEEAASKAFYQISDYLLLPKFPVEINENHFKAHSEFGIEPRSVMEELAILNYLAPEEDIRGRVLCAIHNVYFKRYTDWERVILKRYKAPIKLPESYMVYLFGKDVDANYKFDTEADNWVSTGAILAARVLFKL